MNRSGKKLILFAIAITMMLLSALFLSGCDNIFPPRPDPTPEHEHTFSEEWTSDAAYHWHAATCEHTDVTDGKAEHSFGEYTQSAYSDNSHIRVCDVCGYNEWNSHRYAEPVEVSKAATCAERDIYYVECLDCGYNFTEERKPDIPHTYGEWEENDGKHVHICSVCEEKEEHQAYYDQGTVTKNPECTENGEKEYACTVRGCTYKYTEELPYYGHNWTAFIKTDDEKHSRYCRNCSEWEYAEHDFSDWAADDGVMHTHACTVCEFSVTERHAFTGATCPACSYIKPDASTLGYTAVEGGFSLTGIGDFTGSDLFVPETYNGQPVIAVGNDAFYSNQNIVSVFLPSSVKTVSGSAFRNCPKLKYVGLGGTETLGGDSFAGCRALKEIDMGSALKEIGASAFGNCSALTAVTLPDTVTNISDSAFADCTALKTINFPAGLRTIGRTAFRNSGVTTAEFPDSLQSVGAYAFADCKSLTSFIITSPDTTVGAQALNGCAALTTLTLSRLDMQLGRLFGTISGVYIDPYYSALQYTNEERYKNNVYDVAHVPKTLKSFTLLSGSIGYGGVMNFRSLTSITLGDDVTAIGVRAFDGCNGINELAVGHGVSSVGANAFNCTARPTKVSYAGAVNDWAQITFGDAKANPMCLTGGAIYIGENTISGNIALTGITAVKKYAFAGAKLLTGVTLPDALTEIGEHAFDGCTGITSVALGSGVTRIGEGAFKGCRSLVSASYAGTVADWCGVELMDAEANPASVTGGLVINGTAIGGAVTIGSVTEIGDWAFYNCDAITSIVTDGVTRIGKYAFAGIANLDTITIGEDVTAMGDGAFESCAKLTAVNWNATACATAGSATAPVFGANAKVADLVLDDGVTVIPDYAFTGCEDLNTVTFPSALLTIGKFAFNGSKKMTVITLQPGLTTVDESAFDSCSAVTHITIPRSVRTIGARAFADCVKVTEVEWLSGSSTVGLTVGARAFKGMALLTSFTFPSYTSSIGESALTGCGALQSLTLPFCGASSSASAAGANTCFGYVFGTETYTGAFKVDQFYNAAGASSSSSRISYYIPSSLKTVRLETRAIYARLYYGAFSNCRMLENVGVGNKYSYIESHAFSGCSGLTEISLPFAGEQMNPESGAAGEKTCFGYIFGTTSYNGGTRTAQYYVVTYRQSSVAGFEITPKSSGVFYIPASLRKVDMSCSNDSYFRLYDGAFYGCSDLTEINLPEYGASIGNFAFRGCTGITDITLPDIHTLGVGAFYDCTGLETVELSEYLTDIGGHTFCGCTSLASVVIPSRVTEIGRSAFSGCISLASVTFSPVLETINESAFSSCILLTEASLPASLKNIGKYAFPSNMTSMTFASTAGWQYSDNSTFTNATNISSITLSDPAVAANAYNSNLCKKYLRRVNA